MALFAEIPTDPDLFVLAADCHVCPEKIHRANGYEADTMQNARNFVRDVLAMNPRPAAVLFLGDMVESSSLDSYRLFKKEVTDPLDAAGIPYFMLLGNHDSPVRFYQIFPDYTPRRLPSGELAYKISFPNVEFLLLQTTNYAGEGFWGFVSPAERDWVNAELKAIHENEPEKPVFLLAHHDMDLGKFLPELTDFPNFQAWICGHWHEFIQKTTKEGVRIFRQPSLGFMDYGERPITGYALLRLSSDSFTIQLITNDRNDDRNGKTVMTKMKQN